MHLPNAKFRKLTPNDLPRVTEISSQIWGGEDYISGVIEHWMLDKNCFAFGVFAENKLVAFSNIRWVYRDELKIAWLEGGRVDPKFQNKGFLV